MKERNSGALEAEFARVRREHRSALRMRFARANLGSSVIRVFAKGTKPGLLQVLQSLPVDELPSLNRQGFEAWFDAQLERVSKELRKLNAENVRLQPGLKWGHAAKVLALYVRDLVAHSRYFDDRIARRIEPWLYVPVDGIVIRRLRRLGIRFGFSEIRQINSRAKFLRVQECMGAAAAKAGVPRVWFDDNWADRQE